MGVNNNMTAEQTKLITELAADVKPTVLKIEGGIATTKNNYGRYGALLSSLSGGNRKVAGLLALALIEAGANREGVAEGFKLFV